MSPQFVDFDADGHLDIVAGIFDGSPHVARGSAAGFAQHEQILDRQGARIVMNQFWNFDTRKWDSTNRCDPTDASIATGHLTSAWAADWDGDGDLDLLLGDHDGGHVLLRENEGTAAAPAFATRNRVVQAAGAPLVAPGTVATLRTFDWDGDGLQDLLVGTMGDAYGSGPGGAVLLYLNTGTPQAPRLQAPIELIAASAKAADGPTRPDSGLYMDAADLDGDGDPDLVVGGYSHWTPPAPELDDAQRARRDELQREVDAAGESLQALLREIEAATRDLPEPAAEKKRGELLDSRRDEIRTISLRQRELTKALEPLVGGSMRKSFVWLYENLADGAAGGQATGAAAGGERQVRR